MQILLAGLLLLLCTGCDKLGFRIITEGEYQALKAQQSDVRKPRYSKGQEGNVEFLEFYAWEEIDLGKTQGRRGTFKQVKKNYFMSEGLCAGVVRVLNEPRFSNGSNFECFPAHIDPNEYFTQHSFASDIPNK